MDSEHVGLDFIRGGLVIDGFRYDFYVLLISLKKIQKSGGIHCDLFRKKNQISTVKSSIISGHDTISLNFYL